MSDLYVVTTLKKGGRYSVDDVLRLKAALDENLTDFHFICLSDVRIAGVRGIRFAHDIPESWAAVELFRPAILPWGARVLYIGLNCLVTGGLKDIASYDGKFACLRNPWRKGALSLDMMAFKVGEGRGIYSRFAARPRAALKVNGGFSGWVGEHFKMADDLERLYPAQIIGANKIGGVYYEGSLDSEDRPASLDYARVIRFPHHMKIGGLIEEYPDSWVARLGVDEVRERAKMVFKSELESKAKSGAESEHKYANENENEEALCQLH